MESFEEIHNFSAWELKSLQTRLFPDKKFIIVLMKHQEYSSVLFSIWIKYIYYSIINVLVTYHYFSMNLIYGFFLIVKVSAIWVKPMGIGIEAITSVAQSLPFSK